MKNDIQQIVQAKFCSKLGPKKVRGNATYKYVFSQNAMLRRFFGEFFIQYDLYKITETD